MTNLYFIGIKISGRERGIISIHMIQEQALLAFTQQKAFYFSKNQNLDKNKKLIKAHIYLAQIPLDEFGSNRLSNKNIYPLYDTSNVFYGAKKIKEQEIQYAIDIPFTPIVP